MAWTKVRPSVTAKVDNADLAAFVRWDAQKACVAVNFVVKNDDGTSDSADRFGDDLVARGVWTTAQRNTFQQCLIAVRDDVLPGLGYVNV